MRTTTFLLPAVCFLVYLFVETSGFVKTEDARSNSSDPSKYVGSRKIYRRIKRRKHGDTLSQMKMKTLAKEFQKNRQNSQNNSDINKLNSTTKRRKRYQYEEDYEWEDGGQEYEDRLNPKKEETKFEKWAKNWQKNALKFIFLFSFLTMVCCCCCGCIKKMCSKGIGMVCFHIREWRDLCLCRDPTYRRMRQMADEYGFDLDYSTYQQIKNNYEQGLEKEGHGKVDLSGRT